MTNPKHTNIGTAIDEIARLEREVVEERQRTTVMTLANDDKRQELRALRTQCGDLLEALNACATVGGLASIDRGPVTLIAATKRLAYIKQAAQAAIDKAMK